MLRLLLIGSLLVVACGPPPTLDDFGRATIEVDGQRLSVAVADRDELRFQGLRGVDALSSDLDGMLFVFDAPGSRTFVMEDTLIPLDIWWFDESGRLLGSAEMEPCVEEDCVSYGSPGEVMWVLETERGSYEFAESALLSTVENP